MIFVEIDGVRRAVSRISDKALRIVRKPSNRPLQSVIRRSDSRILFVGGHHVSTSAFLCAPKLDFDEPSSCLSPRRGRKSLCFLNVPLLDERTAESAHWPLYRRWGGKPAGNSTTTAAPAWPAWGRAGGVRGHRMATFSVSNELQSPVESCRFCQLLRPLKFPRCLSPTRSLPLVGLRAAKSQSVNFTRPTV